MSTQTLKTTQQPNGYKKLSLTKSEKEKMSIRPSVKDGAIILDRNNALHRYVYED